MDYNTPIAYDTMPINCFYCGKVYYYNVYNDSMNLICPHCGNTMTEKRKKELKIEMMDFPKINLLKNNKD